MKFLLLTGMSGAGKTAALRFFEDAGALCVDNLPPMMLVKLMDALEETSSGHTLAAFSVDVRSGAFFDADALSRLLQETRQVGHQVETIFLEASDDTLVNRYKESRREHPLASDRVSLTEAIAQERAMLVPLRETADHLIDTSELKTRQLQKRLQALIAEGDGPKEHALRLEVMSFGFKRGLPRQADLVFDVRFLPNPYYIPELCRHTGLDDDVRDYVLGFAATQEFLDRVKGLIAFLLPHYLEEGKHRLVIAIGCTGGAHRSVAITEAIGSWLKESGYQVEVSHRDTALEQAHWFVNSEDD